MERLRVRSTGTMWLRMLLAVGVMAVLALVSYVLLQAYVAESEAASDRLGPTARQRTLSQRTAFLSFALAASSSDEERFTVRIDLTDSVAELERLHASFAARASDGSRTSDLPTRVAAIYFEPPHDLDVTMRAYLAETRTWSETPTDELDTDHPRLRAIQDGQGRVLGSLEAVSRVFEDEAGQVLSNLRQAQFVVFGGLLAGLVATVFVAFRPPMAGLRIEMGALEATLRELETRVEERTHSLRERMDELARSNEELEQFAYVSSHDLQEPLRVISSYSTLLQERYAGKMDADGEEYLRYIAESAQRMQFMIRDLLAYSRAGAGPLEKTQVPAERALVAAEANLDAAIRDSGAVVTHDPLPEVSAHEGQLVQVFQNLVGNAVKFRRREEPRVHVGAQREDGAWRFSVRDNGIGMDPKYQDRVFVIFQRLHAREAYAGTGIGLALCKKIVERHGGRIWYESEGAGRGTTFHFSVPDPSVAQAREDRAPAATPATIHERIRRVV